MEKRRVRGARRNGEETSERESPGAKAPVANTMGGKPVLFFHRTRLAQPTSREGERRKKVRSPKVIPIGRNKVSKTGGSCFEVPLLKKKKKDCASHVTSAPLGDCFFLTWWRVVAY